MCPNVHGPISGRGMWTHRLAHGLQMRSKGSMAHVGSLASGASAFVGSLCLRWSPIGATSVPIPARPVAREESKKAWLGGHVRMGGGRAAGR